MTGFSTTPDLERRGAAGKRGEIELQLPQVVESALVGLIENPRLHTDKDIVALYAVRKYFGDLPSITRARRRESRSSSLRRPDELDIARPDPKPLSFGGGPHYCVGAALARLEAKHAFGALVTRTRAIELATDRVTWRPALALRSLTELRVTVVPA